MVECLEVASDKKSSSNQTSNYNPLDVNLWELTCFIQVAESRGFSKASTVLAIAQPTLSRYVRNLEKHLGTYLFHRNGRGVLLTDAGQILFEQGKNILAQVRNTRAEFFEMSGSLNDLIVLGVPAAGKLISVPVAKRFIRELPNLRLQIIEGFTGHLREWLLTGRIDVGIFYDTPIAPKKFGEALWTDSFCLMGSDASSLARLNEIPFSEIKKFPLILSSRPHDLRLLIDDVVRRFQIPMHVVMEVDGIPAIVDLVSAGLGFTILPGLVSSNFIKGKKIVAVRLVEPELEGRLIIATSPQRPPHGGTRTLLEIIRQEANAIALKLGQR